MTKPSPQLALVALMAVAVGLAMSFGVCTQDDAFISFRYAEHLADGNGLVYNVGERVEGFTNLSWTVLFGVIMALGGEPVMASVLLGWVSIVALVAVTWRFANQQLRPWAAVVAAAFVASDAQMILEGVEGLETVAYATLVTLGVMTGWRDGGGAKSAGWFAVATLTRPEAPLLWVATQLGLWLRDGELSDRFSDAVRSVWPLVLIVVALTAWRLQYYGDWLPNTFYAKTGGFAVSRGASYVLAHVLTHPVLWLGVAASVWMVPRRTRALGAVVAVVCGYIVWVGGDFKPTGRFVIPVLPVLAVLAAAFLEAVWAKPAVRRGVIPVVAVAFAWTQWGQYERATQWAQERHANLQARQLVGDWLAQNTPKSTVLAVHSAGVVPFYSGRKTIDMWGLTNREVARTAVEGMGTGMAGHERSAPEYVFSLNPDVYLPEDKLFTLRPWKLNPEPGVSSNFADLYRPVNVSIEGGWLNMWVRQGGSLSQLRLVDGAIEP